MKVESFRRNKTTTGATPQLKIKMTQDQISAFARIENAIAAGKEANQALAERFTSIDSREIQRKRSEAFSMGTAAMRKLREALSQMPNIQTDDECSHDESCTCHLGHPPCSFCTSQPEQ